MQIATQSILEQQRQVSFLTHKNYYYHIRQITFDNNILDICRCHFFIKIYQPILSSNLHEQHSKCEVLMYRIAIPRDMMHTIHFTNFISNRCRKRKKKLN